jgi:small subunit ribosomal protein S8
MNNDNLANVLSAIGNHERVRKPSLRTQSTSSIVRRVLDVLQAEGYIAGYATEKEGSAQKLTITLTQNINGVSAIKPRFSVRANGFTKFEKRYLPAQGFGVLVVSTPKGIMTHEQAKKQNLGGRLLAYCY